HLAAGFLDENLDRAQTLGVGQRRVLTGGATGTHEMDAGVDLPPAEPPHGGLVELAASRERRHERGAYSGEQCSHRDLSCPACPACPTPSTSRIVYQPRLP